MNITNEMRTELFTLVQTGLLHLQNHLIHDHHLSKKISLQIEERKQG